MKNTLLILLSLIMIVFSTPAFAKKVEKMPAERDGLYYEHLSPNLANGQYERYYANGQLKERKTYKDGKIDGISEYYQSDGTITSAFAKVVKNMPEQWMGVFGLYYEYPYHASQNLANGQYEKYHDNGQLSARLTFKDGKKDGPYESYYESGQLRQRVTYKEGKREGLYERYYGNGQLTTKETYKNGKMDGPFEYYYEPYEYLYEGEQLRQRGTYKEGKREGLFEIYNEDGTLRSKCFWVNGQKFECE